MTTVATTFAGDSRHELRRWLISGAIVVMAHGFLAAALMHWRDNDESYEPGDAIVIDLAVMPVAPSELKMEAPPGPEQIEAEQAPEKAPEKVDEKVEEIVRAVDPDVALLEQPEPPKPLESEPPAPETTAPPLPRISSRSTIATLWARLVMT